MTARFRSAFFGSSGFVAVRPQARVVSDVQLPAVRRDHRGAAQSQVVPACLQAKAA